MKKIFALSALVIILLLSGLPLISSAQIDMGEITADEAQIKLNVPLGGLTHVPLNNAMGVYLQVWYNFTIGTIGILATVMIMWGGFKWLTSRGNSGTIGEAKEYIWSAIIGLMLTFLSYTILVIINPALVTISSPNLSGLTPEAVENIDQFGSGINVANFDVNSDNQKIQDKVDELVRSANTEGVTFLGDADAQSLKEDILDQINSGNAPAGSRVIINSRIRTIVESDLEPWSQNQKSTFLQSNGYSPNVYTARNYVATREFGNSTIGFSYVVIEPRIAN